METQKYYGSKKIIAVVDLDKKTPGGNDMVQLSLEDSTEEVMPKMRFECLVSEEPQDLTAMQTILKARVGAFLFGTMNEFGIKMGEANSMSDAMMDLVNAGYNKSRDILYKVEDFDNISLIDINEILLNEQHKNSNSNYGVAPTGSGTGTEDKG